MEGRAEEEPQSAGKCFHLFPKLPLWIMEYAWAHKKMGLQEALDPSSLEVDSQPLSLEESWRLRVVSAQVYSIMKNRDMEHFDRVMNFLEASYRLLPRLVAPIKHMKIMFGLKTMVIMWMLREGRGLVDTVFKINQFFPSKLPQYQDQCTQHEMFLMRKNHLDFKALAHTLAMKKDRLEDYIKDGMEQQYGEHYAQKVEDRLLHYLHQLETLLPGETHVDKILKKGSPVTEEERLLLEVLTSDSMNITTTLKKLLHCDAVSCRFQTEGGEDTAVSKRQQTEEDGEGVERVEGNKEQEESAQRSSECDDEAVPSPQFCSKHQRWVKSILQECPDECSEELLLQANRSSSPPLFQSSSSTSSSQDLTPSGLISCPPDQQQLSSQTSTLLHTAAQSSEQENPKDEQHCGAPGLGGDPSPNKLPPQPSSHRDTQLSVLLSPVVQLIDIAFVRGIDPACKPLLNHLTMSGNKQAASASSRQALTSPHRQTDMFDPSAEQFEEAAVILPLSEDAAISPSSVCGAGQMPSSTESSQGFPRAIKPHTHSISPVQSETRSLPTGASSTSSSDCLAFRSETRTRGAQMRLSLPCQAVLLQSTLLQPYVSLDRLSAQECHRATNRRSSSTGVQHVDRRSSADSDEEQGDSFDLGTLYSSYSSSSEDSLHHDPDYKPSF